MPRTAKDKGPKRNTRSRNWIITWNNPDAPIEQVLRAQDDVRFACGQREIGEECGTLHEHAYVEFTRPRSHASLRKLLPKARIEERKGTREQARVYCSKEETLVPGTRWEFGEWAEQGKRNDLREIQQALRGGASVCDIYDKYPMLAARYPRFIDRCADYATEPRNWKTEVRVFLGPTGCGKTQLAHELLPDIWVRPDGAWFDGYDRHKHVLFDDFDGGRDCGISYRFLLRLLDRYRLQVPIKGGFKEWVPRIIIITTNVEPRAWYPWEDYAPLERRIDEIRRWSKP